MRHFCLPIFLIACSTQALAQSSVTLYGMADDGLTYTNNQKGASLVQTWTGSRGSSRFGFKGVEDLGGGIKAVFQLENGFNVNTGQSLQGGREFGRLAFVGLSSPYGSVLLGRQTDIAFDALASYATGILMAGSLGTSAGDVNNAFGDYILSNQIKYVSPKMRGVSFSAVYAPGGVAGSLSQNQIFGASVSYDLSNLHLTAVYRHLDNPAVTQFDATATPQANGTFVNPVTNPIFAGYASARKLNLYGAGAKYQFGKSVVAVNYTTTRFDNVTKTSSTPVGGISPSISTGEINYTYRATPALLLGAAASYTLASQAKYGQWTLGSTYALSPRTFLYLISSWQHAIGTNSLGQRAVANIDLLSASTNANQVAVRFGIHHNF
jgi:predicted porin